MHLYLTETFVNENSKQKKQQQKMFQKEHNNVGPTCMWKCMTSEFETYVTTSSTLR